MTRTRTLADAIGWMNAGSEWLEHHVDQLSDDELAQPSTLSGWTRAHLVADLARNADALGRLLSWAGTGIESPMYSSPEQRSEEIAKGALESPMILEIELTQSIGRLSSAVSDLPDPAWSNEVRSALGRTIPASEVPWLRTREVWLHAVDLGSGARLGEIPDGVTLALVEDIVDSFATREGFPSLRLHVTGGVDGASIDEATYVIGDGGPDITANHHDLLGWLSGRSSGAALRSSGGVPTLPRWL